MYIRRGRETRGAWKSKLIRFGISRAARLIGIELYSRSYLRLFRGLRGSRALEGYFSIRLTWRISYYARIAPTRISNLRSRGESTEGEEIYILNLRLHGVYSSTMI